MKIAVLVFPGSNCDQDMYHALKNVLKQDVEYVFHTQTSLSAFDVVTIPGGFSYGDYLRCGAIARFSPIMKAVKEFAESGKLIIGVCNGFQILIEMGLLEGALMRNEGLKFVCNNVDLRVVNNKAKFTQQYQENQVINLPIAHGEGNYYCNNSTYEQLKSNNQILFEYVNNPNGSMHNIAGICNKAGNVLGMMPHPERAVERLINTIDGLGVFESFLELKNQ